MATAKVLVVGAGSGAPGGVAGVNYGAGGAAGVVRYNPAYTVAAGAYSVTVGVGSAGTTESPTSDGGDSVFDTITATGGNGVNNTSRTGGSNDDHTGGTDSSGVNAGGGAGAGADGSGQDGGDGVANSITGSSLTYGRGGAGGSAGVPGTGGGGTFPYGNGTPNRGDGAGAGTSATPGGTGGSGVVIVAYTTSEFNHTGGDETGTNGSETWVKFTSSGTLTLSSPVSAPTVTTQAVSDVGPTTATGNGNVTSDGGATVTERGVCVSTSANPTTADDKFTAAAGGTGAFTAAITGRTRGTLYHVRAYAINSEGTSYGADVEFTTTDPHSISGVVSLSGTPVSGATAICIRESDDTVVDVQTTDGSGAYSFAGLDVAETYHICVEYETGGVKYNALSKWGITPAED